MIICTDLFAEKLFVWRLNDRIPATTVLPVREKMVCSLVNELSCWGRLHRHLGCALGFWGTCSRVSERFITLLPCRCNTVYQCTTVEFYGFAGHFASIDIKGDTTSSPIGPSRHLRVTAYKLEMGFSASPLLVAWKV